jgi:hypothetical protein
MKKLPLTLSFLFFTSLMTLGQSWLWAKGATGNNLDSSWGITYSIAADSIGNVYATGNYNGSFYFGAYKISTGFYGNSSGDAYMVKYNANGNVIWANSPTIATKSTFLIGSSVSTDYAGDIYMAGYWGGEIKIGQDTLNFNHYSNGLLVKYDTNGNVLWVRNTTTTSIGSVRYIACTTDKNGNVYVTGSFNDTIHIGAFTLDTTATAALIVKYDKNGNAIWAKSISAEYGFAITISKLGNIYVAGNLNSTPFVAKFDTAGNNLWIRSATASGSYVAYASSVATDNTENVYITGGSTYPSYTFGNTTLSTLGNYGGIFFVKYDKNGNVIWAKDGNSPASATGETHGSMVFTDKGDNIYLSGCFEDTLNMAGIKYSSPTADPSFIIKFDSSGNFICGAPIQDFDNESQALAVDPLTDNLYYGGNASGYAEYCILGNDSIFLDGPANNSIPFLAKWTCDMTTGLNEHSPTNLVTVYPNPSNGKFYFQLGTSNEKQGIEIYNIFGEKVYSQLTVYNSAFTVDINSQPSGIYLFRLVSENGECIASGKLVIQK